MLRPEQVKPYLSHPEAPVRNYAARYLAGSFDPDPSLVPLVLRSCDEYGEEACMFMLGCAASFVQTELGLRQVLNRLARTANPQVLLHYSEMIARADIDVLRRMLPAIRGSRGIVPAAAGAVQQRMRMHALNTDELWAALLGQEPDAAGGRNDPFATEFLADALAARDDLAPGEVTRHLEGSGSHPPSSEVVLVRLAGAARITGSVPHLVERLGAEHDLVCIEAASSLARIGGTEVVALLHEGFTGAEPRSRYHSAPVLGDIKLRESETALLDLVRKEQQPQVKISLATSLCMLGSVFGLPHAASTFLKAAPKHRTQELSQSLYAARRVLGMDSLET